MSEKRRPNPNKIILTPEQIRKCENCGNDISKQKTETLRKYMSKRYCSRVCQRTSRISHGHTSRRLGSGSLTYRSWKAMICRCGWSAHPCFSNYGGRGVYVCDRWKVFENFLADMGERTSGTSLDRIDSNGNYEPGNCRWASRKQQGRNRRDNVHVSFNGEERTISEWADITGIRAGTLYGRLKAKWPVEKVLTTPTRKWPNRIEKEAEK